MAPGEFWGVRLSSSFDVGANGGSFATVNLSFAQSKCPAIQEALQSTSERPVKVGLLFARGSGTYSWSVCLSGCGCGCCSAEPAAQGSVPALPLTQLCCLGLSRESYLSPSFSH